MTNPQRTQLSNRRRPVRTPLRWMRDLGLATTLIFIIMVEPPGAQTRPVSSVSVDPVHAPTQPQRIGLLVGRSTVLTTVRPIQRVALSIPDIADALVTSPNELLIHGKSPGIISLLVWSDTGDITNYDVVVRRDLDDLRQHVTQLFPGEEIAVAANGTDIVLAGTVSSKYVVEKASAVAVGYVEAAENVVNLLRQREQEGVESEQVMLRVRFAEVSRTALQELGVSFFTDIFGSNGQVGRVTTQQFAAPDFNAPNSQQFGPGGNGLVFSDFLNIVAFNNKESIGLVIRALETRGLFQSLAEPNLITQNGTEATFLAGGEYPYPILQGVSGAVTVLFKEFGIRLAFTPTIVGQGRIQLKVAPEVSALDFSNSITIDGFRVPALSTRRTETQVELNDGQTFAIAGLLDNSVTETMSKIPGLGDIPILGRLFKSRAYQKSQSELVVMITPHIVRAGSSGVASQLPDLAQPFLSPSPETLPPPPAVSTNDVIQSDLAPAAAVARLSPGEAHPSLDGPASGVLEPRGAEVGGPDAAARLNAPVEREGERVEEKASREEVILAAEEVERAAKAERERLEVEREQAEQAREVEEQSAREAEKLARAAEERAAEQAQRAARAEQERLEVEREEADQARRVEERSAREAEKLARAAAKRDFEDAERIDRAEQQRLEVELKQAERVRKEEEKQAERARKEEEKRAIAQATADAERYERDAKQADELAKERAEREADVEQILVDFQHKLDEARRAVDEIAQEQAQAATPTQQRLVVPIDGLSEANAERR